MNIQRLRISINGAVQGVGFRPYVYRIAHEVGINGWVINDTDGVIIEAEATESALKHFVSRLRDAPPPHAVIETFQATPIALQGEDRFEIRHSHADGQKTVQILPDLAVCPDCLRELYDPSNRRYRYPFINCTHCGPRFTIIQSLPYDRPNTTMRAFVMCNACRSEYENPVDRRFHAQPIACPNCGPQLALWDRQGQEISKRGEALHRAAQAIRDGQIVALKGLGGFQLVCDARNAEAVATLRCRKHRPDKPFAVMMPTLDAARAYCHISTEAAGLLQSAAAPIVLLERLAEPLPASIAPNNPYLGVMLPYTPLHHLLMTDLGFPIVATSGNLAGEPICTDEFEALRRLQSIADCFLVHDRPIARHADDSVMRMAAGRPLLLRRARGYAPTSLSLPHPAPPTIAFGAHQKNVIALASGKRAILSQHIGDLDTLESDSAMLKAVRDFQELYSIVPQVVAADRHPEYQSTRHAQSFAAERNIPLRQIQHHHAHILAVMGEHHLEPPVLGIAWDGTGLGDDGAIWGGEFLYVTADGYRRIAHLGYFPLPGGDVAVREPRRSALGLLWAMYGEHLPNNVPSWYAFSETELRILMLTLRQKLNTPITSSIGRLFDAFASLMGVCQSCSFEGQAAMALEFAAMRASQKSDERYPYLITPVTTETGTPMSRLSCKALIEAALDDFHAGISVEQIAWKFHVTLADMALTVAKLAALPRVVLAGGVFQNRLLLELTVEKLRSAELTPYWAETLPPNDGAIAYGQMIGAGS
ncbi:MAG: carbamoyltransferase HypF [Anaerolineae bacterium]